MTGVEPETPGSGGGAAGSGAAAAEVIAARAKGFRPRVGLILGSGLGGIADAISDSVVIPYGDLPGFHVSTVAGHAGRLVLGELADVPVACLQGRAHVYEGVEPAALRAPVRALRAAGAELLLITSASGSLREDVGPGRLMLLTDHINMLGVNPLSGPNDDEVGPRFPSLRDAYDPELRERLRAAAAAAGIPLAEGVYLAAAGPSFETPAEIRAFRTLGADAVGMSTVPEAIVARHCGLRVAAVTTITNLAEGMSAEALSHEQTLQSAERAAGDLQRLIEGFLAGLRQ
jgi:xanthosine phosphorylase